MKLWKEMIVKFAREEPDPQKAVRKLADWMKQNTQELDNYLMESLPSFYNGAIHEIRHQDRREIKDSNENYRKMMTTNNVPPKIRQKVNEVTAPLSLLMMNVADKPLGDKTRRELEKPIRNYRNTAQGGLKMALFLQKIYDRMPEGSRKQVKNHFNDDALRALFYEASDEASKLAGTEKKRELATAGG